VIPLKSPGDSIDFLMTWDGIAPATLTSVTHTVPSDLSKVSESNTTTTSTVRVSGGVHGQVYSIKGTATLNTGRTLERTFPLRMFYGAS
jgi:hypothetical protein